MRPLDGTRNMVWAEVAADTNVFQPVAQKLDPDWETLLTELLR